MQTVNDISGEYRTALSAMYEKGELEQILFLAFEHVCGFKKSDLVLNRDQALPADQMDTLKGMLQRLKDREPIQYIIGSTEFYGLPMKVNRHVLIPRQETEELVDLIIKEAASYSAGDTLNIVDFCTGSGCIAIALKKNIPHSNVYALDVSSDALKVAEENAALNHTTIRFIKADIFHLPAPDFKLPTSFDIIVSNPPYIVESQKQQMADRVLSYEPHLALFADDDGLSFYRTIADLALDMLRPGGKLFFEINELKGSEVCDNLISRGFKDVKVRQDLNGKDRMVWCIR